MKPAFLIIDMQNEFYESDDITARSFDQAIPVINEMSAQFRACGLPVVVIQHQDDDDGLLPGTKAFELPRHLIIEPDDVRIVKTYGNAFNKTPLLDTLKRQEIDTVILSGYCAEFCVLNTCRGAKDVDLFPVLLRGALASGHPERIRCIEDINDIISPAVLRVCIKSSK